MVFLCGSWVIDLLAACFTIFIGFITYQKWVIFKYWERKNMPYFEPTLFWGNLENPLTRKYFIGEWLKKLHDQIKARGLKHSGGFFFTMPFYMPVDPEMIRNVMQRDFSHFVDRGFYFNEKDDPLRAHLFSIDGQKWRNLRMKLTPTFTSGKMKMMFETLMQCGVQMEDAMSKIVETNKPVDIKDFSSCFTTDVIGSCVFGLDCNSFKTPDSAFRKYGKRIFEPQSKIEFLKHFFALSQEELAKKLRITVVPADVTTFFMNVVKDTVQYRKTNNLVRNDMLQLLIDLQTEDNNGEHDGKALTIEEIAAQVFVFFIAGFESSSTTMAFCLYELATNPKIQEQVRKEINNVLPKHNNELSYDAIMDMKFMQQVIDETLRKYPPLAFLNRKCVSDYKIPETDVILENGTKVFISVLGLHRDPEYFPEPEVFNPERFSDENKKCIRPFSYMPFGEGPRMCIGIRFGIMQTKVGLAILLKNFLFSVNKQTVEPFVMDPFNFILTTEGGIWLDAKKNAEKTNLIDI